MPATATRDKPTNVLSFPATGETRRQAGLLGDLVICPAVLRAEARAQGKRLAAHWAHLVVHGVLHLVGFDHERDEDAQRMQRREIRVLRELGFAQSLPREMSMPKNTSTTGRWRSRLTRTLAARMADRATLIEMLAESKQRGVLDADAFAMLEGVLEVADLQVRDIMVPRAQMICLRREEPLVRILSAIVESGHSRFPVLADDRDDVVGILLAKDLLRQFAAVSPEKFDIREYLRPRDLHSRVQAAERAAEGISRQPQPHGDRGG